MHEENREGYICDFIDECEKLEDKKMAMEMAIRATTELRDHRIKLQYLAKINRFYAS